jgi:hypothetical protein
MAGRRPPRPSHSSTMGIATDATGGPVIDPTLNVKEMMAQEVRRLDDIMVLNRDFTRREMELRAEFSKEQRVGERDRLDAIRLVDVSAVQRAAEVQAAAAAALAQSVTASAEALRTQQATANAALIEFVNKAVEPITASLAAVQRFQYEQGGARQQVVEQRDTRGDSRSDRTTILLGLGVLISILMPFILRATGG